MADASDAPPRGERSGSASKRKRVAIACVTCRARKARCDGRQPCSSCSSMGFQCIYSQSETSSNLIVGREYMSDLETRVRSLEHAFGGLQAGPAFSQSGSSPGTSVLMTAASGDTIEAPGLERGLLLISAPNQICFGPSSTIDFTRKVFGIIENMSAIYPLELASVMNPGVPATRFTPESERPSGTTTPSDMLSIVFNDQARQLVTRYFDGFGLIVPIVHRASFLERFELAKNGDIVTNDKSWLALLNIVLALSIVGASAALPVSVDQMQQASTYQVISQQILRESSLDDLDLNTVQCRCLTSHFFAARRNLVRALEECNAALHQAMHLGLHSSDGTTISNPTEEVSRIRTWLAIVQHHRMLCAVFGRPILISKTLSATRPEQAARDPVAREIIDSRLHSLSQIFFSASRALSDISTSIIEDFYGNNASRLPDLEASTSLHGILSIDKKFTNWMSQLPPDLTLTSSEDLLPFQRPQEAAFSLKFRTLLSLRYLNTRLLLYRPLCMNCCREASDQGTSMENILLQQLQIAVLHRAYESASEVIEIVYALSIVPQVGSWLYLEGAMNIHHVFSAALTVLLVLVARLKLTHRLARELDVGAAGNHIDRAVAALEWLNQGGASSSLQTSFLRNALAAITNMNPGGEATLYPAASAESSAPDSNQAYFQSGSFAVYEDQTNIYRDLDLEGFLGST